MICKSLNHLPIKCEHLRTRDLGCSTKSLCADRIESNRSKLVIEKWYLERFSISRSKKRVPRADRADTVLVRRPYGQLRDLVALSQKKSPPKTRKHTSHGCPSERRKRRAASERRARGSSTSWRRTDRTRRLFLNYFSCEKKQLALKINALRKIAGLEIFRPEKLR